MSESTYTHGSGGLFKGLPAAVESADTFLEEFDISLSRAIDVALKTARAEIQDTARLDPEWAPYADLLDIEYTDGEFHYVLNGEQERIDEALAIEYGDGQGRPANSIIRKLALR